ncbi:MAG: helix-turn-helix domain-containing protein [Bacillota bacterium]|nr:helix-turn-helix domain-containing protein [Bacillota bacterium]MDP4169705.1 helix-turn-helix domain-containing protein [Bacillota bacterium]
MKEALSHRQLQSLIKVSNVLNSSLDIDTIIDSIMVQTVSVIEAAHGGVLFLYDPKLDRLVAKSNSSFNSQVLSGVRLKPGESMTGLSFSAQQCMIFANRQEVDQATSTLSAENLRLMLDSIPTIPYSSMCAPIFLKDACIGVITLDSFDAKLRFIPEDIHLLQAISDQAAVALEKASLYREKAESVRQLESLNETITKQNELLTRSVEIHNSLAELLLNGKGLDSIIRYIHQTIGQEVFLFDDLGELISSACSSPLLANELNPIRSHALERIESTDIVRFQTDIELDGSRSFQLITLPIGTKPNLFGTLVIAADDEVNDVDIAALEHACSVISLEMIKEQAVYEAEERRNAELIEDLFSGKIDETLNQKTKHFNFDHNSHFMAIICQMDDIGNLQNKKSLVRHLVHIGNRVFFKNYLQGMAIAHHEQLIILLAFQQKVTESFARSQVTDLVSLFRMEIERKNWANTVSIGIGRLYAGFLKVNKSLQDAAKCLQFLRSFGQKDKVVHYRDLGVQRLLLQNSEEELIEFILETLGPILENDSSRKGELLPSLLAYLEHNQHVKEAAKAIHVHTNTLTYRLKRIEDLLSGSLSENRLFLDIQLAVSLYPFFKNKLI